MMKDGAITCTMHDCDQRSNQQRGFLWQADLLPVGRTRVRGYRLRDRQYALRCIIVGGEASRAPIHLHLHIFPDVS